MPRTGYGAPPAIKGPLTAANQSARRSIFQVAPASPDVDAGESGRHGLAPPSF
jgi:hypothetical protein